MYIEMVTLTDITRAVNGIAAVGCGAGSIDEFLEGTFGWALGLGSLSILNAYFYIHLTYIIKPREEHSIERNNQYMNNS